MHLSGTAPDALMRGSVSYWANIERTHRQAAQAARLRCCRSRKVYGGCNRSVDVRPDTLPQDRPWSRVGWCLVCKECGAAASVNIVPNWHDMRGHAVPFSRSWKS